MAEQLVLTADTQKRNPYVPLSLCVCVLRIRMCFLVAGTGFVTDQRLFLSTLAPVAQLPHPSSNPAPALSWPISSYQPPCVAMKTT